MTVCLLWRGASRNTKIDLFVPCAPSNMQYNKKDS